MKRWQIFLFLILALGLIAAAGYFGFQGSLPFAQAATPEPAKAPPTVEVTQGEVKQTVINPGQLVSYKTMELLAGTNGPVTEVNVRPGDTVKEGDVLVRFGNRVQLEAEVAQARLAVLDAQEALASLHINHSSELAAAESKLVEAQKNADEATRTRTNMDYPRASELSLENAETKYLLAKETYKEAKKEYEEWAHKPLKHPKRVLALQKLVAAKQEMDLAMANWNWLQLPPSESAFAEANTTLSEAEAALELAQITYDALKDGVSATKLTRAEVDLNKAELDLELAETKLEALALVAPFDGVVLEVDVIEGQSVAEGANLIKMTDPLALEVVTSVIEEDYPLIEVGQPAELYFDSAPGMQVTGWVDRIIPQRSSNERPLYTVYIAVEEIPDGVVEGMTADASIILDQRSDVLRLPRALVQAKSDNTAEVKVWVGDHEETRAVTVGLRGDVFIEILEGLKLGDQVVGQ